MIFKKIAMEHAEFSLETLDDVEDLLKQSYKDPAGPCGDIQHSFMQDEEQNSNSQILQKKSKKGKDVKKGNRRNQQFVVRDLILALSLCHNVSPTYPNAEDPTYKEYQASSPDEVALVKFSDQLNMNLVEREEAYIRIINVN